MSPDSAYGLWILVAFNSVIFIAFAISFFHPHTGRDWRAMGAFSAFPLRPGCGWGGRRRQRCLHMGRQGMREDVSARLSDEGAEP
jgi:hypothetical protein